LWRGTELPLTGYEWSSFPAYAGRVRKVPSWLERERVLSACGIAFKRGCFARYAEWVEHRMDGETPADEFDEAVEKQLRRGWFIGGDAFKKWLAEQLPAESDNLRGEQRRAHDEVEAERLLVKALSVMNLSEESLLALRNNSPQKQGVAWLLKSHTTVTGGWIAERLCMGDRSNVSRALRMINRSKDSRIVNVRRKMTQCTG
jgi:hypothetical protein